VNRSCSLLCIGNKYRTKMFYGTGPWSYISSDERTLERNTSGVYYKRATTVIYYFSDSGLYYKRVTIIICALAFMTAPFTIVN
jgi:hypothetical protein